MPDAISNTSPFIYLHRIGVLDWLPRLFSEIWTPSAVVLELEEGRLKGYDVPNTNQQPWLKVKDPESIPSAWLPLDLGAGELAAMALAMEKPDVHSFAR